MAPEARQLGVRLRENEAVAQCLLEKWRSMEEKPGGLKENLAHTLAKSYRSVCAAKEPIRTLKDLYEIKGVGKWVIRQLKGSFPESSPDLSPPESNTAGEKGKKAGGSKRYVPQKNSAAYAILITLHRETINGKSYMKKQELIDATEASGLSRSAIGPDKSKAKPGAFASSQKDWYTGWSCMKTLTSKGLVSKSGNPAKYMITEEGKFTALDCLSRSGLDDHSPPLVVNSVHQTSLGPSRAIGEPSTSVANPVAKTSPEMTYLTSQESLNYKSQVRTADNCAEEIILSDSDSEESYTENYSLIGSEEFTERVAPPILKASNSGGLDISKRTTPNNRFSDCSASISPLSSQGTFELQSSSTLGTTEINMLDKDTVCMDNSILAMPPRRSSDNFLEDYEVVLVLDDRENFGDRLKPVADNIRLQFRVPVEIKHLPVGDGIWIARDRKLHTEYVLDFIVERKNVADLCSSITDNRYKIQKLSLKKCGLKKLIYLVEGDPNPLDSSERIKTACFTTEILEGFDVQRTTGYADTVRTYGYLTRSIIEYYSTNFSTGSNTSRVCPTYDEFKKKCDDLKKVTVSDLFALQLMQVPQVTEEAALAVIGFYPTIFTLAQAYSMLDGDTRAQEEMLKNKSTLINAGASRNIFKLIWGEG
ncbi:crossover junction endonuclease MUS81 [Oryza brachyantha]|uniref:Crossover junction endonuclease MUS81 n=1 Tax=Oryza brachyantha TaxID=4533 RepID=J3L7T2_ORYBR|nr:crossover junction endonuclease MUS81 [Oryza brachyantha]XP_015692173.1 crossover junction endonuclease MUS81 [Oryza brachyantha]